MGCISFCIHNRCLKSVIETRIKNVHIFCIIVEIAYLFKEMRNSGIHKISTTIISS